MGRGMGLVKSNRHTDKIGILNPHLGRSKCGKLRVTFSSSLFTFANSISV